ncbi:MAG: hypothetical protein ACD_2C00172G0003 [uncultured bacterium (gcode 4)]|uniref:Uncharacterized protein n=1 Tax=uncultured bacterium (gcode 4) TaxID=1234023 RepID=K2H0U5_9BACT|nr:MAG: hypothetical protein ACD_2C00172G0003 [uncultured bacterium (gcode 4)]
MKPKSAYPILVPHVLIFGFTWFMLFYSHQRPAMGFLIWLITTISYLIVYVQLFGKEQIRDMLIGGLIWVIQVYGWLEILAAKAIDWTKEFKTFDSMPMYYHLIPATYFIMWTFLVKNVIIDLIWARNNPEKMNLTYKLFYAISLLIFILPNFIFRLL